MNKLTWGLSLLVCLAVLVLAYEFNGPSWQSLPAQVKKNLIWTECQKDSTPGDWPSAASLLQMFVFSMDTTFDTVADDMPYQGVLNMFRRKKLIHSVGAISQIRWVSNHNHPYTGLFNGSNNAFLRFSHAKKADFTSDKPYAPGLSFKFLRTGKKSANFMAMVSLEGVSTPNFFLHDLTNHVPDLGPNIPTALKLLKAAFEKASKWPTMLALSDFARYDENGNEYTPNFPFRLIFHPTPSTRALFNGVTNAEDIAHLVAQRVKTGTMFQIYAEPTPGASPFQIGTIEVTSPAITSSFSDQYLFFQHQRIDDDFKIHPEWVAPAEAILQKQRDTPGYTFPDLPDN